MEIPGFINLYAVHDALTEVAQLDTLRFLFNDYLDDIQVFTVDTLDSSISAFHTLALTSQAHNRSAELSDYIYRLCDASDDT